MFKRIQFWMVLEYVFLLICVLFAAIITGQILGEWVGAVSLTDTALLGLFNMMVAIYCRLNRLKEVHTELTRLRAAAPDLLEACKKTVASCFGCNGNGMRARPGLESWHTENGAVPPEDSEFPCPTCSLARTAIAKATGTTVSEPKD